MRCSVWAKHKRLVTNNFNDLWSCPTVLEEDQENLEGEGEGVGEGEEEEAEAVQVEAEGNVTA